MLHMFFWMFVQGCNGFQVFSGVFFQVFQKYVSSVSTAFRRMLQLLYLDISKVDRVCGISPPDLLLHRLSRRRQAIHTTPLPGPSESEALRAYTWNWINILI
jgi:hypothetical protein